MDHFSSRRLNSLPDDDCLLSAPKVVDVAGTVAMSSGVRQHSEPSADPLYLAMVNDGILAPPRRILPLGDEFPEPHMPGDVGTTKPSADEFEIKDNVVTRGAEFYDIVGDCAITNISTVWANQGRRPKGTDEQGRHPAADPLYKDDVGCCGIAQEIEDADRVARARFLPGARWLALLALGIVALALWSGYW